MTSAQPLNGHIAVVAGATRGAGRGIARGLGELGATVYCTGRSVRGNPSPYNRPETIEETAELVTAAGGVGVALRVDHAVESEVEALFTRIGKDHGRLDVLASSIGGENPLFGGWSSFWQADLQHGVEALRQSLLSHLITAKHAAALMIKKRRGLIVEVTEGDTIYGGGGNVLADVVKSAQKGVTLRMAEEIRKYRVTAVAVTPGFLRSETMLEHFGVTEANWRDGGKKDKNFLESETPLFIGRAVAALAADPNAFERSGDILSSWELGRHYGLTDADGRRPDWGIHGAKIFASSPFGDMFRRHVVFLQRMTARASQYIAAADSPAEAGKTSRKRRAAR